MSACIYFVDFMSHVVVYDIPFHCQCVQQAFKRVQVIKVQLIWCRPMWNCSEMMIVKGTAHVDVLSVIA